MTAVEWLVEQFEQVHTQRKWKEIIEQAKEIEKQQILDAYEAGNYENGMGICEPEQYYNETFNLSQQDKP
jgi:hypothetical protein